MSEELRIVFLGTPDFAAETLKALVESGIQVVAVVTAADKPKGRGKKIAMSAVKEYALSQDLPILQPTNLKSPEFVEQLKSYQADLQVVVAFRMLPEVVWNMPRLGTLNLHASLLPQYRGAAPINWAIINGEKETGVTTFFLKHEIDTGEIIFQEKEPISSSDTVGDLYERLMKKGAQLVVKTVQAIQKEDYQTIPQQNIQNLKLAPKIFKEDCKIDWDNPTEEVFNFIRGLSPYPAAWAEFGDKTLKIFQTEMIAGSESTRCGEFSSDGKSHIHVSTRDGLLSIKELQLEGKKRMNVEEFLRGYKWTNQ